MMLLSFHNIIRVVWGLNYLEHDLQLLDLHEPQLEPLDELAPDELFDEKAKVDINRSTFESLHFGQETEFILLKEQSSSNSLSHFVQ
jgi:hypothetical protein